MTHFIFYGLSGWCLEVIWTGLGSLLTGDIRLTSTTYLWMFPIYGIVFLFEPLHDAIRPWPLLARGIAWMLLFFSVEYFTGCLLRYTIGTAPWNYYNARLNIQGLIRLDYAPVWFAAGLLFEKVHDWLDQVKLFRHS